MKPPRLSFIVVMNLLMGVAAWGQSGPDTSTATSTDPASATEQKAPATAPAQMSEAERITFLHRSIEQNLKSLEELKEQINSPESEYIQAKTEFENLNEALETKKKDLEKLLEGDEEEAIQKMKAEVEELQQQYELAKERFNLAIGDKKAIEQQIVSLQERIQKDEQTYKKLTQPQIAATQPTTPPHESNNGTAAAQETAPATPTGPATEAPEKKPPTISPMPGVNITPTPEQQPDTKLKEILVDQELEQAKLEAEAKTRAAEAAQVEAQTAQQQIESLQQVINIARERLETARRRVSIRKEQEASLLKRRDKLSSEGAAPEKINQINEELAQVRAEVPKAEADVSELVSDLEQFESELQQRLIEQQTVQAEADIRSQEVEELRRKVEQLENPWSWRNIRFWLLDKGIKILSILVVMIILLWVINRMDNRLIKIIVGRSDHGTRQDRENRAQTLVSVFHNTSSVLIIIGGVLMILKQTDLDITTLLGGVAVIGLAVAFGAQNLIKDFFSGFMILLENQYGINDVVKINGTSGLVERITLRITVLRDLEGIAHFIPNGQVNTVSNMTHQWSRVVLDIGVAYKENVDHVMNILMELGHGIRQDPKYRHLITDDPEMLGVDSFADSAVVIKMLIRTRPLQQWTIKREMLRRIKNRFDELNIEIPFPQRSLHFMTNKIDFEDLINQNGAGPGQPQPDRLE